MNIIVSGEGKQDFVDGLKNIVEVINCTECIVVDLDDNTKLYSSQYMALLESMQKKVNLHIVR